MDLLCTAGIQNSGGCILVHRNLRHGATKGELQRGRTTSQDWQGCIHIQQPQLLCLNTSW